MSLNVVMADLYGSALLGARMFKEAYQQQGLKPVTLAMAMSNSGTTLAHIIPWNVMGAILVGTLGLAIADFASYAFVAYLAPVVAFVIIYLSKGRMAGGEEDTAIAIDEQVEGLADDLTQLA